MKKLLFLSLCVVLASCQENLEEQRLPVSQRTTMSFTSHEDFQETVEKVSKMSNEELDRWENANGFVSYRSVLKQAYTELDTITTAEAESIFKEKYSDILTLSGDTWQPVIDIPLYQAITNRDGIYKTNGYLNRVVGGTVFTVEDGQYHKLEQIKLNLGEVLAEERGIRITQITGLETPSEARVASTCSTYQVASYFHNESNCRNDRRVFISGRSYIALSTSYEGDLRQPRVEIEVWGQRRTGTWCNWISYSTMLHYRNVSFTINAWTMENGVYVFKPFTVVLPDASSPSEYTYLTWDGKIGTGVLNQHITAEPFTSLHAEGTSRGAHGVWVTLDCR